MEYYSIELDGLYKNLESSEKGLADSQVKAAADKYGLNELVEKHKINPAQIFINQFKSFIVGILIIVLVISLLMNEMADAIAVLVILVLNAVLGFIQEYNAERAIDALRKMSTPKARVVRDGREQEIDSKEVVPGDIIVLSTGDKIPADARVIEVSNLQTQEAALTGESVPIEKSVCEVNEGSAVANRVNTVFASTIVTKGHGKAVVVATGMSTEFGKIAKLIQETADEPTPLQLKLKELGKFLGILSIVICVLIFIINVLEGTDIIAMIRSAMPLSHVFAAIQEPLKAAIALAVAAIPEGLPAVVTISLALGVQRMIKRNALIRKLPSVETLGATTVICTDKTGTLTHNEMTVKKVYANGSVVEVSGAGYSREGSFGSDPSKFELLLKIGALNNDSKIAQDKVMGDPTEGCLLVSAEKAGLELEGLSKNCPRIDEIPFDSERKLMTTIHKEKRGKVAYTKGAPDMILRICDRILINGKVSKLTPGMREDILQRNEGFGSEALRVLGFAYKELNKESKKEIEKNMVFVGLQAMIDPPRQEVKTAIAKCKTAGIKVVMITGDYKATAVAIANELGIEGKAITGEELDKITNFEEVVEQIGIYARVNPEHKMRIVEAFRKKGHVVAMTGDGVNDAPALKNADIGIAMGITGTDVAKEASDVVLTDDNFASIVNAVEEGRGIYENIKNFVQYLLSCNIGEVLTILFGLLLGFPFVLLPLQLLLMNILTDGLPALALGVEPVAKGIMERRPRQKDEKIFTNTSFFNMMSIGLIMGVGTIFIYYLAINKYPDQAFKASTMAFTTLVLFQMFNVFNSRAGVESAFSKGFFSNKYLIYAVASSMVIQLIVVYTPLSMIVNDSMAGLGIIDWLYMVGIASTVLIFEELIKKFVLIERSERYNGRA